MSDPSQYEIDARMKHIHDLLEKVIQVNGFFITAGYGTFFGVWAIAREDLVIDARIWSCLFLLASAIVFVAWHMFSLMAMNFVIKSIAAEPSDGWAGRIQTAITTRSSENAQRFGIPITLLSAFLALVGISILTIGLLRTL
ncbi:MULTISPECIES: hypothetical protein [Stenotrophomonas]|uniref:hypothetical protein n=1 Tax=Stenotrophomonas TaxID=40323 RepID=UPI000770072D|nr:MULTISPECIES: hypothetical protein [Stenotrophomonas]AMJ57374.1 hypothetical protein AXG53_12515 [Stenotrophomonas sp. KCTC 12332]